MPEIAGLNRQSPIEAGTGTPRCPGHIGIEQPGMGRLTVFGKAVQRFRALDSERLDDPHPPQERSAHLGSFISMELDRIETDLGQSGLDQLGGRIDEESDTAHERG